MSWVDVFSGGLEDEERLSKNEINSRHLLDWVCFGISLMFRLYTVLLFCSHLFIGLCTYIVFINNIFAVKKNLVPHIS
jgi:hypothetical protein